MVRRKASLVGVQTLPDSLEADLVGMAITGPSMRAYAIADRFRVKGIPVVLGGVHPTLMPEEASQHADAVVTGFAEESWSPTAAALCDSVSQLDRDMDGVISYNELMELRQRKVSLGTADKMMELFTTHPNMRKRIKHLSTLAANS